MSERRKSYTPRMPWVWVNHELIFIFGWTNSLSLTLLEQRPSAEEKCANEWSWPGAACWFGWAPRLSFLAKSPTLSSSVCSVWRPRDSSPGTSSGARRGLRPWPVYDDLRWAAGTEGSASAAFAAQLEITGTTKRLKLQFCPRFIHLAASQSPV